MEDVSNIIRIGQVSSVNPENGSCRVAFDDMDGMVSDEMQVVQPRTVNRKDFSMPDVGEHVLCLFLPNGNQEGFVLGSYYTAGNLPQNGKTGLYRATFSDGTVLEYDLNAHMARLFSNSSVKVEAKDVDVKAQTLTINVSGAITIHSDKSITLTAPRIDLN